VASKGYDVQFGARPLKRAIQNYIEDGISDLIVNGNLEPGSTIHITLNENELAFS
jgi:ATP-dependent Clp protease ATP-binding subunit ClpC